MPVTIVERIEPWIERVEASGSDAEFGEAAERLFDEMTDVAQLQFLIRVIPEDLRDEVVIALEVLSEKAAEGGS